MKRVILRVMMLVAMASAAVTMSVHTSSKEVKASEKGDAVVKYAKNFVGNRYRYGGSSLTKGTDCSGFTRGVYKKFGKRLPPYPRGGIKISNNARYRRIVTVRRIVK